MNTLRSLTSSSISLRIAVGVVVLASVATIYFIPLVRQLRAEARFSNAWQSADSYLGQTAAYLTLLREAGGVRGQEIFAKYAPDNDQMHVVNHVSGSYVYDEKGIDGVRDCRGYFTGSCYHGFVTALIANEGSGVIPQLAATCQKAASREDQLSCAHGVGHGLSQYARYDMVEALDLCISVFASETDRRFCFYGVSMENRAPAQDMPPGDRLFDPTDPMYPCNDPRVIERGAHQACYITQSQISLSELRYPSVGGDVERASRYCSSLPDENDREICVTGIAVQIFFADKDESTIHARCERMDTEDHRRHCRWIANRYAYYFGDRSASTLGFCESETDFKSRCYEDSVYRAISMSHYSADAREQACRKIPEMPFRDSCAQWMKNAAEKY